MKTTKKFLAIFLAMTMLFTVCSLSVLAVSDDKWTTNDNRERVYDYSDDIDGEGSLKIYPDGRTVEYRLWCYSCSDLTQELTLYAQCAVIYTDGSSDCYSVYGNRVIGPIDDEVFGFITLPTDKDVDSFSLEFQIHSNGVMLWEGYFDVTCEN